MPVDVESDNRDAVPLCDAVSVGDAVSLGDDDDLMGPA